MNDLNLFLTVTGFTVIFIGLFNEFIKSRVFITEPIIALILGIVIGPLVLNLINPYEWDNFAFGITETARITLAISLMGVALRIPSGFIKKNLKSLIFVLTIIMSLMFISSGILVYIITPLPLVISFLIGGAITPTDPVLSSSIVTGKMAEQKIPARLRNFISSESGANDGLAYLLVMLPFLILHNSIGKSIEEWLIHSLLIEVLLAAVLGGTLGYVAGFFFKRAEKRNMMTKFYSIGFTIALTLLVLGGARLIPTDGIFAVFVSGIIFDNVSKIHQRSEQEHTQEAINLFFIIPVFILLGMSIPLFKWIALGWKAVLLILSVIIFRRLGWIILFKKYLLHSGNFKDALFIGWFGPIGIAALYYISYIYNEIHNESVWVIGTLIITASIFIHGISTIPVINIYFKRSDNKLE